MTTSKCLNPRYGTVHTFSDITYNRYWYDAVQEHLGKHARQMNQIIRCNMETDAKEDGVSKRQESALYFKA